MDAVFSSVRLALTSTSRLIAASDALASQQSGRSVSRAFLSQVVRLLAKQRGGLILFLWLSAIDMHAAGQAYHLIPHISSHMYTTRHINFTLHIHTCLIVSLTILCT